MRLDGYIGDSEGRVDFDELSLDATDSGSIATSGDVTASAGTANASFGWDIDLDGSFDTDDGGCFWTDYDVSSGSAEIHASSADHSLAFGFDFGNLVYDEYDNLVGVDLTNGFLRADGELAFTFTGTLDDQDGDGTWGDRLTLTFEGETMTLEAFLVKQDMIARGGAALRGLGVLR